MYVKIRPHYSKTRGLSSVLNLRTSSTQIRRPTCHEPTSPEHGETRSAPSEWRVPAIHRGTATSSKKSEVLPTGRVVAWPLKGHRRLNVSSPRLSGLVPTIHPLLPGLGPVRFSWPRPKCAIVAPDERHHAVSTGMRDSELWCPRRTDHTETAIPTPTWWRCFNPKRESNRLGPVAARRQIWEETRRYRVDPYDG